MTTCMCGPCRRERQIRLDERRLRSQAPPLPPAIDISYNERLLMIVERARWLYDVARWTQSDIALHLNDHDLVTPYYGCAWTQPSVSYWLRVGPTAASQAA